MPDPFPIIQLPDDASLRIEQLGSKTKFWLERDGQRGLFKAARKDTGEDWSEVAAACVAEALDIPHAKYDLATHAGRRGVISWSLHQEPDAFVHGNEILSRAYQGYPSEEAKRWLPQHTVRRALNVCMFRNLPLGWTPPANVLKADHLFVGYLMLDALIGNTDRHDQNWAWIIKIARAPGERAVGYLSPTYDHGSSLGRNLSDAERHKRITTHDSGYSIKAYAERARSCLFLNEHDEKPGLNLEVWALARTHRPKAASAWIDRLSQLDENALFRNLHRIPHERASTVAIDFACGMIQATRNHLLTGV